MSLAPVPLQAQPTAYVQRAWASRPYGKTPQATLAAASDGTRKGVRDAAFSGNIRVTADESVIGKEFSIDTATGDVTVRDMSIQLLTGGVETFLKAWPVA